MIWRATLGFLLAASTAVESIKHEEFRLCGDTAFCRRQRSLLPSMSRATTVLDVAVGTHYEDGVFTAALRSPTTDSLLTLEVMTLRDATVRARIFEPSSETAGGDPRCSELGGAGVPACSWSAGEEGTGEWGDEAAAAAGGEATAGAEDQEGQGAAAAEAEEGEAAAEAPPHRRPRYDRYDASAAIDNAAGIFARRGQFDCGVVPDGLRQGKPAILLECEGYTVAIITDPFELSLETPGAGGEGGDAAGGDGEAGAGGEPPRLALNSHGLLHYEQYEAKGSGWGVQNAEKMKSLGIDVAGMGEPEHHNGHTDLPKRGPSSVGLDVDVSGASFLYGIPERAEGYNLEVTKDTVTGEDVAEPYRLWNLDVFEYEHGHPMRMDTTQFPPQPFLDLSITGMFY